ncbi:MAG: hypothetical protein K2Q01_07280, partial [Rickettsiales bacterium]|nr:hypothetical protein [Rickettsiales bacterium]
KILRHYDASLAPLLKMALEDSNNMIRVQAATAMTKLKNMYFDHSVKLEHMWQEWPKKNGIVLELARLYDNYAFSGLLEETQAQENRNLAMNYYLRYLEVEPKDSPHVTEVLQLLARLLFRMQDIPKACEYFERLRQAGHDTPEVNLWYAECLYRLGRLAELRELAAVAASSPDMADDLKYTRNMRGTLALWAGGKAGAI